MTHERLREIREIVTDSRSLGNALESFHREIQELLAAADCLVTIKQHSTIQNLALLEAACELTVDYTAGSLKVDEYTRRHIVALRDALSGIRSDIADLEMFNKYAREPDFPNSTNEPPDPASHDGYGN